MASIFRRDDMKNAAGTPAFYLSYKGLDGRRHRERTNATTPKEAKLLLARRVSELAQAEGRGLTSVEAAKLVTFKDYAEKVFFPHIERRVKASSFTRYQQVSRKVFDLIGAKIVQHIRPKDIRQYVSTRGNQLGPNDERIRPATINKECSFISGVMQLALQDELIPANPVRAVESLYEDNKKDRWLTPAEFAKLVTTAYGTSSEWLIPIMKIGVLTGMRLSEILAIQRAEADADFLKVTSDTAKNKKARYIKVTAPIREVLQEAKATALHLDSDGASTALFVSDQNDRKGKRGAWKRSSVSHAFTRLAQAAGFETEGKEEVVFHTLRHTACSWMVQRGISDRLVMKQLGHGSAEMVSRYAHLAPESLEAPAEALAQGYSEVMTAVALSEIVSPASQAVPITKAG